MLGQLLAGDPPRETNTLNAGQPLLDILSLDKAAPFQAANPRPMRKKRRPAAQNLLVGGEPARNPVLDLLAVEAELPFHGRIHDRSRVIGGDGGGDQAHEQDGQPEPAASRSPEEAPRLVRRFGQPLLLDQIRYQPLGPVPDALLQFTFEFPKLLLDPGTLGQRSAQHQHRHRDLRQEQREIHHGAARFPHRKRPPAQGRQDDDKAGLDEDRGENNAAVEAKHSPEQQRKNHQPGHTRNQPPARQTGRGQQHREQQLLPAKAAPPPPGLPHPQHRRDDKNAERVARPPGREREEIAWPGDKAGQAQSGNPEQGAHARAQQGAKEDESDHVRRPAKGILAADRPGNQVRPAHRAKRIADAIGGGGQQTAEQRAQGLRAEVGPDVAGEGAEEDPRPDPIATSQHGG